MLMCDSEYYGLPSGQMAYRSGAELALLVLITAVVCISLTVVNSVQKRPIYIILIQL